ncbi:MAG: hypothetical protein ABEJ64_01590 [Candidatus Nanohaloarchaea archaeon]
MRKILIGVYGEEAHASVPGEGDHPVNALLEIGNSGYFHTEAYRIGNTTNNVPFGGVILAGYTGGDAEGRLEEVIEEPYEAEILAEGENLSPEDLSSSHDDIDDEKECELRKMSAKILG